MAKTILIVDDNLYIRRGVCELFKRESDFEVCGEAENGKEAIAKALELRPDLIVLDLSMPLMNGIDVARSLRDTMPSVQIIMFTLFVDTLVEAEARSAGIANDIAQTAASFCRVTCAR
jgi:YesN/AraC family two-component response regulator